MGYCTNIQCRKYSPIQLLRPPCTPHNISRGGGCLIHAPSTSVSQRAAQVFSLFLKVVIPVSTLYSSCSHLDLYIFVWLFLISGTKMEKWLSISSCASKEVTKLLNYNTFWPCNRYQNKCSMVLLGKWVMWHKLTRSLPWPVPHQNLALKCF